MATLLTTTFLEVVKKQPLEYLHCFAIPVPIIPYTDTTQWASYHCKPTYYLLYHVTFIVHNINDFVIQC